MVSAEIETMLIVIGLILVVGFWVGVSYILSYPILFDYHEDKGSIGNKTQTSAGVISTDVTKDRYQPHTRV